MRNLLYNPALLLKKTGKTTKEETSLFLAKNIKDLSWDGQYIYYHRGFFLEILDPWTEERRQINVSPLISLTENGALSYDRDSQRCIFYQMYKNSKKDNNWVQKTVHILASWPKEPLLAYVGKNGLYLVGKDKRLFVHKDWREDHEASWVELDLKKHYTKASKTNEGIFFTQEKDGLLFIEREDRWIKTARTTSFPVQTALRIKKDIIFKTERGLEDRSGKRLFSGVIKDIAHNQEIIALLTADKFYLLNEKDILAEENLRKPCDRILLAKEHLLLVDSESGEASLRKASC